MSAPDLNEIVQRPGTVIIKTDVSAHDSEWKVFCNPLRMYETPRTDEAAAMLERVENEVQKGYHAAGFIAYEAAAAFDSALKTREGIAGFPLIWFGIYDNSFDLRGLPDVVPESCTTPVWTISQDYDDYERVIARLRAHIAAGNTYQVNYTLRMSADFNGNPWPLFLMLRRAQRTRYSAYIHTHRHTLCSVSPELFFERQGDTITCRPMKGTAARGMNSAEDRKQSAALAQSAKDRAENVMIVDMIRNDLGKIAVPGSVRVPELFVVERYDTVFQMTSTVTAETKHANSDVIRALFPCASVTGAPKVRTMQIIAEEESAPRGIYTGCIGYFSPPDTARFSVAIRTIQIDHRTAKAIYGTGGGIVWDSAAAAEYAECRAKTQVLFESYPSFSLIETIRWERDSGYFLLEEHLLRLRDSAAYFAILFKVKEINTLLTDCAEHLKHESAIVCLLLNENGQRSVNAKKLNTALSSETWRVALAKRPVNERNRFLYHKTTNRAIYDDARLDFPDCDDVILWNTRGEITEATRANIVVRKNGKFLTPLVSSGLLDGVFRRHLLASGQVEEAALYREDLAAAEAVYLINSVRGWITAEIVHGNCISS
jgi:para-aminobenzoate synthetase / 4-amino-4-deoxychorismate lyase